MDPKQKAFAAALTAAREAAGLTQYELGEMVGRTQQAVAKWENAESMPTRKSMGQLIKVLPDLEKLGLPATAPQLRAVPAERSFQERRITYGPPLEDRLNRASKIHQEMIEFEQQIADSLPAALRPNFRNSRGIDYQSENVAAEIYRPQSLALPHGLTMRLWTLSTERLRRGDAREYCLIVVLADSDQAVRFQRQSARLLAEAYLHGVIILTAESPEQVAQIIAAIEKGEDKQPDDENNLDD